MVDYLNMPSQVLTNMTTGGFGIQPLDQPTSLTRNYIYDAANRLTDWNYAVNIYRFNISCADRHLYIWSKRQSVDQAGCFGGVGGNASTTSYTYDFENRLNQLTLYQYSPNITGTQTDNLIYNGEDYVAGGVEQCCGQIICMMDLMYCERMLRQYTKSYTRGLDFSGESEV